ncbi:hypothetical protein WJX82_005198 [Trebouxia sp. C0006]
MILRNDQPHEITEYTEGDKADMHEAGFAVNGFSIDGAFDINDSMFDLDLNGGGRIQTPETDHGSNEEDFDVADCRCLKTPLYL